MEESAKHRGVLLHVEDHRPLRSAGLSDLVFAVAVSAGLKKVTSYCHELLCEKVTSY